MQTLLALKMRLVIIFVPPPSQKRAKNTISDAEEIYVLKHRLTDLTKIGKNLKSGWVVKGTSGACEDEIVCV